MARKGAVFRRPFERRVAVQIRVGQHEHDAPGKRFQFAPGPECRAVSIGQSRRYREHVIHDAPHALIARFNRLLGFGVKPVLDAAAISCKRFHAAIFAPFCS